METIQSMPINQACLAAGRGEEWFVHLEFVGVGHDKFWEAWGVGHESTIRVRYGKNRADGTTIVKNWSYFSTKVREKVAKGYKESTASKFRIVSLTTDDLDMLPKSVEPVVPKPVVPKPVVPKPVVPKPVEPTKSQKTVQQMMAFRKKQSEW